MNQILNEVLKNRNGHYVHAFEVEGVWELKTIIESICNEHSDKLISVIIDFLESAELYCLNEEYENEVYSFNIANYVLLCVGVSTMKYHNDLNINELRIMYCIFNPMFKSEFAQYNWINKQCLKYAKKHINSNCNFHFEFSKQRNFSYLSIFFNNQVIKMQCRNSYFVSHNLTKPKSFN